MIKRLLLFFVGCLFCFTSEAQQLSHDVVSSAGAEFSSGNFQLDWTLGEISTATFTASTITLTEGFQQAEIIFVSTRQPMSSIQITSYPNPFHSNIYIEKDTDKQLKLECMDVLGRLVASAHLTEKVQSLDLSHLASAVYFLKITNENGQLVSVIKIQKN